MLSILTDVLVVGVPIVVTFYLIKNFQKLMDKFTDKLGKMGEKLWRLEK